MIIGLHYEKDDSPTVEIVHKALIRSFSIKQIYRHGNALIKCDGNVFINPGIWYDGNFEEFTGCGRKILIFGLLSKEQAKYLGLDIETKELFTLNGSIIKMRSKDISPQYVEYKIRKLDSNELNYRKRYASRFDFEDEWNNHGYGQIKFNACQWSIQQIANLIEGISIASIMELGNIFISEYIIIKNFSDSSIMWFNRPVGPVDSLEWILVEDFFSNYRKEQLACFPCLLEIPHGYDGTVTMHIDCDEAISSANQLIELYKSYNFPLTLAIKTGQDISSKDLKTTKNVIKFGGSIASHSVLHLNNWGEDFKTAFNEAGNSKKWLEKHVTDGKNIKYAVSPFYQNPPYAVEALAEAGYHGFVGGISCNDPEYLLGRAGIVPFSKHFIISHSQQCMLHGDCFHRYGGSIRPYIESFENHFKARAIFGYLDHPFSTRYSYGWYSEEERLAAHDQLLKHIKKFGKIWFCNLDECLDFIESRSRAEIWVDRSGELRTLNTDRCYPLKLAILWKGIEILA